MKQHKWNVHKTTATFNPITADSIKVELSEADSSEYEDDLSDSENDDLPELYREHEWDGVSIISPGHQLLQKQRLPSK